MRKNTQGGEEEKYSGRRGGKILRKERRTYVLREEKWENIEGGKVLREERRKYSGRRGGKILRVERRRKYSGMRGGNTQGGEEEEGGATGERERVTISRCQPAHLHQHHNLLHIYVT